MEPSDTDRVPRRQTRAGRRFLRRDERGAALVEFALVFWVFVMILYGLVTFGMMLALKQSMTNAASEGARTAVGKPDDSSAMTAATTTVRQRLSWLSGNDWSSPGGATGQKAAVTITPTVATCNGTGKCLTVVVTYSYSAHPLVPLGPGFGFITPSSFTSQSTVQYR